MRFLDDSNLSLLLQLLGTSLGGVGFREPMVVRRSPLPATLPAVGGTPSTGGSRYAILPSHRLPQPAGAATPPDDCT